MEMPTLLDIAKANGSDGVAGLIDETTREIPELRMVPARTILGADYKTLVRTSVPQGHGFRDANEGRLAGVSGHENRLVETYIAEAIWKCDKAVADVFEDGPAAFIAREAEGIMTGVAQDLGKQFYYGKDAVFGNAKGFPGLLTAYDTVNLEVDAGGTTDDTCSSLWAIKLGPKDVIWVWGMNGQFEMPDVLVREIMDKDADPLRTYPAYIQSLLVYPGLQVGNIQCIGRIKNLTEDVGHGLTDELISELLSKFPVGKTPDLMFASMRSISQLHTARSLTAITPTGDPPPFPTSAFKVPLVRTASISDVETLALGS